MKLKKIESVKEKEYSGKVYDLEVNGDHSYNIERTVVHNSVCSTRVKTGVGVPQVTAIQEISDRLDRMYPEIPVIADGGIRQPGDACKALAAGADTVMVGSILAGTDQTPGELKARETDWPDRELYKEYRGSASQGVKDSNEYVEGVTRTVPYRGSVKRIIGDVKDGLRSSYSYVGARVTREFQAKADLQRVSGSTNEMGKPHH
jgi:IMP dehydrogenase/GMP reductase